MIHFLSIKQCMGQSLESCFCFYLTLQPQYYIYFVVKQCFSSHILYKKLCIKGDYSQYQHIMGIAFVNKAYDKVQSSANIIIYMKYNKFALRTFYCLAYDREISSSLVASYLLGQLDHYTLSNNVESINFMLF